MGSVNPNLEKIGALSEAGGTVTLEVSTLTIGGRQVITEQLQLVLPTLTANNLYYLYAINSLSPQLVLSQNPNSVGPVGSTSWKLVGALYANGLGSVAFGSFVNIEGKPVSNPIPFDMVLSAESTPPTRGGTVTEESRWERDGKNLLQTWTYKHVTAGVQGLNSYIFKLPQTAGFTIDTSDIITLTDANIIVPTTIGRGYVHLAASPLNCHVVVRNDAAGDELMMRIMPGTDAFWGSTVHQMGNANLSAGFHAKVPVNQLTDTPLKDL